jgi:hypothetical protein
VPPTFSWSCRRSICAVPTAKGYARCAGPIKMRATAAAAGQKTDPGLEILKELL